MVRLPAVAYRAIGAILTLRRVSTFHLRMYRATRGSGFVGHALGVPLILLTTTGRSSGESRTTPLVGVRDGDAWLVVASNGARERLPGWAHNLRAEPAATVRYRTTIERTVAREAVDDEHDTRWAHAVAAYPGFEVYQKHVPWRIPVFVLEPEDDLA